MNMRLNIDLGELAGEPEELYAAAHWVSIACGGHAGDRASVERAMNLAQRYGAVVGAHPSYPDTAQFGRVSLRGAIAPADLQASLVAQLQLVRDAAEKAGVAVHHVKPHGALYHDVQVDEALATALLDAVEAVFGPAAKLKLVASPIAPIAPGAASDTVEPVIARLCRERGVACLREGFADRGYDATGRMLPRGAPGAVLTEMPAIVAQLERFAEAGQCVTLCVHGDHEGAALRAQAVRTWLDRS